MSRQRKAEARRGGKTEEGDANGTSPTSAMPAAAPSMSCSAMPIWKKRSGWASRKMCMSVYLARSAGRPAAAARAQGVEAVRGGCAEGGQVRLLGEVGGQAADPGGPGRQTRQRVAERRAR